LYYISLVDLKCNHLSMGGRLILLKFVMYSLPIYFLSFFKASTGIIYCIKFIIFNKKKGGGEDIRKTV